MLIQANTKSCLKGIEDWGSGEFFAVNSELKNPHLITEYWILKTDLKEGVGKETSFICGGENFFIGTDS